jgi:hypothetical protein
MIPTGTDPNAALTEGFFAQKASPDVLFYFAYLSWRC